MSRGRQRDGRVVILGITFETESADLSGASYAAVTRLGDLLNRYPALKVAVVGHTDHTGPFEFNIDPSERRAQAIAQALQTDFDVPTERLAAVGVGPSPRSTPPRRTTASTRTASSW